MKPAFQMRAILEAVLFEYYGLPRLHPLSRFTDRVKWRGTPEFIKAIESLTRRGDFTVWGDELFRELNPHTVGNHDPSAVPRGWRENVPRWSVQVIQHGEFGRDDVEIEADIDRANPDYGLAYLVLHGILDVAGLGHPTPEQVAKALLKRGIRLDIDLDID